MDVGLSAMYLHDPKWKDVLFPIAIYWTQPFYLICGNHCRVTGFFSVL